MAAALLAAVSCQTADTGRPALDVDPLRGELRERAAAILTRAIRLATPNPPGDEAPLARFYAELLRRGGIESAVIETPRGESTQGRALAWGRLRGSGNARPIVLLSHLDVVPASRSDWRVEPFAGVREGGFVVGRGALDAKGVGVVHLLTLVELARRGITLDRDVVFLATPDEEAGGRDGAGFVVRERPDLLHDAAYLITEGGGVVPGGSGRPAAWNVGVGEKAPCWLRVVARGTPGHSSVPRRDAAVPKLIAALERVRQLELPVQVTPEVERMFAHLAPLADPEDAAGFSHLRDALALDSRFRRRFLARSGHAALVRHTLSITVLQGASRTNVVPREAIAHLDARLVPGGSCEAFTSAIRETLADPSVDVENLLSFEAPSSPIDTPLYRAIEAAARRIEPRAVVVPRVGAGFTDAHYFRKLGITAYGFTPRWLLPEEARRIHGPNERISVANLERGVETLIEILRELDADVRANGERR